MNILSKRQPISIFCLYATKDTFLYEEFDKHVFALKHQRLITLTSVHNINPGIEQAGSLEKAFQEAQIVLCFLSADFFNTSFWQIAEQTLKEPSKAHPSIVPIFLYDIDIEDLQLSKLKALPRNALPITTWPDKHKAFKHITEELRTMVEDLMNHAEKHFTVSDGHRRYLRWLIQRLSSLEVQSMPLHQPSFQVRREEVLIPLAVIREEDEPPTSKQDSEEKTDKTSPLPFFEAVLRHSHLLLLGEPGSGKTMCLYDLAVKQAQQVCQSTEMNDDAIRLPILLRLTDFVAYGMRQGKSLSEYLAEDSRMYGCDVDQLAGLLQTALQSGKGLVLLDGLDEVAGTEDRLAVVQCIETFLNQYKHAPNSIILTSRLMSDGTVPFSDTFARYRLCKLDEAHLLAFLQTWYPLLQAPSPSGESTNRESAQKKATIDSLHREIHSDPALLQLAEKPLFLRILIQLYQADVPLPQQRITLYTQMTQMLLQRERLLPGQAKVFWQLSQSTIRHLLRSLGFWLHTNKPGGTMRASEIVEEWKNIWPIVTNQRQSEQDPKLEEKMRYLLRTIADQTGILIEATPDHYRFAHLTFEEYFAACYLVAEATERTAFIRSHLHEAHWQEPILFALGLIGMEAPEETHKLVESVLLAKGKAAKARGLTPSRYEDLLGRDFIFALRCLENDIPVRPALVEQLIERLYQELAYHTGSGHFSSYLQAIGERLAGLEKSTYASVFLSLCLNSMGNPDDPARLWAVYRCVAIGRASFQERENICQRLQTMLHDKDTQIRLACLQGLHDLNDPGLRDILLDRLRNDAERSVQERALQYLGEMGTRSTSLTEVLLHVLQQTASHPGSFMLRQKIVAALGQLEDPSSAVISALLELLPIGTTSSPDTHILASLRQLSFQSPEVLSMMVNMLQHASRDIHPGIIFEMVTFGPTTPQAREAFLLYTLQVQHYSLRTYAAQELQQLEEISEQAEETLQIYLSDKERDVRLLAVEVLCAFDISAKTFFLLSDILSTDTDVFLRTHIMQCLIYTDCPTEDLLHVLFQAAHDPDAQIRSCAMECLGKIAPASAQVLAILLVALSSDPSHNVRESVVRCFLEEPNMFPKKALPVLVQALADKENTSIRQDCARLLGQHSSGNKQTIQALIQGLSENDHFLRQACSQALVLLGQRFPQRKRAIMRQLEQYIQKQQNNPIGYLDPADMAFQALWLLSTDSSVGEDHIIEST